MKKVYFSIREDITDVSPNKSSDHKFVQRMNEICDLHLVHPCEYDLDSMSVKASYHYNSPTELIEASGRHTPEGDLFIIFSDGSNRNRGLDFAKKEYEFLKILKDEGYVNKFFNEPETEEKTMKSGLVELCKDTKLKIANTLDFSVENAESMIKEYGSAVAKPIFGCQMAGVMLLKDAGEIREDDIEYLNQNYVLQEPLSGDEKRVVVMDGSVLMSRVHKNRPNPWNDTSNTRTEIYEPSPLEREIAIMNTNAIGAYLAGIDFIGDKINEINGSGTGIYFKDENTGNTIDKTGELVEYVKRFLE
ncbi:MAG: ATP-grasp domain-containing protein, partial [Nanoarchaeota archaeon]